VAGSTCREETASFAQDDDPSEPGGLLGVRSYKEEWPRLDGLRVLVVEDNDDMRELFVEIFTRQGATVLGVPSGLSALTVIPTFEPDVIVTDIWMSQINGFDLIKAIRSRTEALWSTTPAIAVTALAEPEEVERTREAGFQDYLKKPVDPVVLLERVLRLSRSRVAVR
jgi:CheY-like chemotaxis protein